MWKLLSLHFNRITYRLTQKINKYITVIIIYYWFAPLKTLNYRGNSFFMVPGQVKMLLKSHLSKWSLFLICHISHYTSYKTRYLVMRHTSVGIGFMPFSTILVKKEHKQSKLKFEISSVFLFSFLVCIISPYMSLISITIHVCTLWALFQNLLCELNWQSHF